MKFLRLLVLLCGLVAGGAQAAWLTSWMAAPDSAGPQLPAQTIRQVVRTSVGGTALRVRLSNLYGRGPLIIGPVQVGLRAGGGAAMAPHSERMLSFNGQPAVTIAEGASVLSDPVMLEVAALQELVVSLHLPVGAARATLHGAGMQTAWLADGTDDSRYFLTGLEVMADDARTVVVVGDSIADGIGSTADAYARWPDLLAARLAPSSVAVVNAGIAGNRLTRGASRPFVGDSILARLQRDALDQAGVRWIVLHAGINDISAADMIGEPASAQQIIDGLQAVLDRAHARGVLVCGVTLLPYGGVGKPFVQTAEGEAKRQAVNAWIRGAGRFDALTDADLLLRDPAQPMKLLPAYDSGDHLHPNDLGYQVMAKAMPAF